MPQLCGHPATAVTMLCAEHTILKQPATGPQRLRVGDKVQITPAYHDLSTVLHDYFVVVQNNRVVDVWPLAARGRID